MNRKPFITCAVTGGSNNHERSPHVPVTPQEIAYEAIEAAKAGAAVAHIHVRDPETGVGVRDPALFREVVERIREQETDVILNLSTGMGGDLYLGPGDDVLNFTDDTDCVGQEICSLDCGSFNYVADHYVYVSTTDMLRWGSAHARKLGVKPELEVFDLGQIWLAKQLIKEGLIDEPPLFQVCMGIPWGVEATARNFVAMVDNLPSEAHFAGFALGAMEMPMVAQTVLLGGNVRVGLEDNLYLSKGVLATNAQLVERARTIVENMGATVQTPSQTRALLDLRQPS